MKKLLSIVTAIVMVLAAMPMAIFAADEASDIVTLSDSLEISAETRQKIGVKESDFVVKVYRLTGITSTFSKISNIDEIEEKMLLGEHYAVLRDDGEFSARTILDDGSVWNSDNREIEDDTQYADSRTVEVIRDRSFLTEFLPNVEIYASYYLDGEGDFEGNAIYYKTNKGDYVYYYFYLAANVGQYLFPIKDFCEFSKAICAEKALIPGELNGGGGDVNISWDLSKYDINNLKKDSIWPTALVCLLVLSVAGVVVLVCVRRKRKKSECEP